ncbi:MAG TPA: ImmA/IrrE family metallo-endopeptidase [Candidatus Dormibacteraeota bacterium]|nr:ImmA/IrrE family metallo-endopeptidase [Candidatus Dormibacteraeota bacterium]
MPVEHIASSLGVQVVTKALADDVSGLLIRPETGAPAIVVNKAHPKVRQRFTIAHELGHLVLHKGRPVVVDHVRLNLRDARSRAAVDVEEIEANAFAAELLMPRALIVAELNRASARSDSARLAADLAEGFGVSKEAAEYRLINLGISGQV